MKHLTASAVFAVTSGLLFSACLGGKDSSVKTLDAIASGGITKLYQCKGANEVRLTSDRIIFDKQSKVANASQAAKNKLQSAVTDYFSAINPAMQELFLKLGGNVLITDSGQINDYCRASRGRSASGNSTEDSVHGCFLFVDDPTGQRASILTIVHSDSPERIRYFGPQIFGYLYAQFYSRLTLPERAGASFSIARTEGMQFITYKDLIADAFLKDMLASNKYNLDTLAPVLGVDASRELRASQSESSLLDALSLRKAGDSGELASEVKNKRRAQILDFFFAHAFQSMNCNAEATEVTRRDFPKSLEAYTQVNMALLQLSTDLSGIGGDVSSSPGTFNLAKKSTTKSANNAASATITKTAGLDFLSIIMAVMPLLSRLGNPNQQPGLGNNQFGNNQYRNQFTGMLNGNGMNGMQPGYQYRQTGALTYNQPYLQRNYPPRVAALYGNVTNAGCPGGNCGQGVCSGGSCSGGTCGTDLAGCSTDSGDSNVMTDAENA